MLKAPENDIIVLPIEAELPERWRLMRKVEVCEAFDEVRKVVDGMESGACIALHETDFVLSNTPPSRSSKRAKRSTLAKPNATQRGWVVRIKRVSTPDIADTHADQVNWMLLRRRTTPKVHVTATKLNLTFNQILEFVRAQLVAIIGPDPAHITLSFIYFSTGTYIEDESFWKLQPESSRVHVVHQSPSLDKKIAELLKEHKWMKKLVRRFNIFIDFQTKRFVMHEVVGGLLRKSLGDFTYKDSLTREYAKTTDGFQHCITLELDPQRVIDPDLPMFKDDFRFHIMCHKLAIRWFPNYGVVMSANSGETEHFLKWNSYDCQLKEEHFQFSHHRSHASRSSDDKYRKCLLLQDPHITR